MQSTLDRPRTMQIHRFMKHSKRSCLDLQFVLPSSASKAGDIQKTVIFVNTIQEIRPIITIIQGWMNNLGYPDGCSKWIRPYYSIISDWDKGLIAKAFCTPGDKNTECTILVATDTYSMAIDNPDVKLVIQWGLPLSFDSMMQRMRRAGRDGGQSTFVLLTPKWSRVKNQKEIETRLVNKAASNTRTMALLSDSNRPKASTKANDGDTSDMESSLAGSEATDSDLSDDGDPMATLLATEAEASLEKHKKARLSRRNHTSKRAKIPDDIFDYINIARCRRLFSLACYDDLTYAQKKGPQSKKALPTSCCNGPSCNSPEPEYLQREPFIEQATVIKYTEADLEWIACRIAGLNQWRKETSRRLWLQEGLDADAENIPDSLIMPDTCLLALAKDGEPLEDQSLLVHFLEPWYDMAEYAEEILICIKKNSFHSGYPGLPSKAEREAVLKAARASMTID